MTLATPEPGDDRACGDDPQGGPSPSGLSSTGLAPAVLAALVANRARFLAFLERRVGRRDVAEEILQDAFVRGLARGRTLREDESAIAWFYRLLRNAIVDRARARTEMPADIPEEPSTEAGPSERAEQGWVAWRIHRALEELPEREREVIKLAYWSGLSQSEVAEFLGLPLGTVKTRTRAALAHLANLLDEELA